MSNIKAAPPLSAYVIMMWFLFCRLISASRLGFVRLSCGSLLLFEDFLSWLITVKKVSTQLGNLSGNQLLLLLNLGSFELFSVNLKCALSLILR